MTLGPLTSHEPLNDVELELLDSLRRDFGFDYQAADPAWLRGRIKDRVRAEQLMTVGGLREKALHDHACRQRLLRGLMLEPNTMFHEPGFYRAFRQRVVPMLRTYPFIRLWHVGCSTGEEVYSMAILLAEEGLYERCRLYATDTDEPSLRRARDGIYSEAEIQDCTANYHAAGGKGSLSDHFTAGYGNIIFRASLRKNLVFAQYDLETDGPFNEFHAIVCRGALTALLPHTQDRAYRLFSDSLVRFGFLCLGDPGEPPPYERAGALYEEFDSQGGILRRIR